MAACGFKGEAVSDDLPLRGGNRKLPSYLVFSYFISFIVMKEKGPCVASFGFLIIF